MTRFLLAVLLLAGASSLSAAPIAITQRVADGETRFSVNLRAPRAEVASRLSSLLKLRVVIANDAPATMRLDAVDVNARGVLNRLADQNGVFLIERENSFVLQKGEPTVTLDVKDGDVRTILRSVQRQCGIRNLMVDRDVEASGTFLLTNVPCGRALSVITRTLGLGATGASTTMTRVTPKK